MLKSYEMDDALEKLCTGAQSEMSNEFESALFDLRLIIERHNQDRFDEKQTANYLTWLRNKKLIDYRFDQRYLTPIKHFLFFILFNFPDRSVLVAKCIKVLFDKSAWTAICAGIKIYMKDDDTCCELIFAITDLDDNDWYDRQEIVGLFEEIRRSGGEYSRYAAESALKFSRLK
jgi:hypothetical protein